MNRERIEYEMRILRKYLGDPSWIATSDDGEWLYLYTGDQGLTLHIHLDEFPYVPPPVFIDRMLHDRMGKPLNTPCHENHTLEAWGGKTRICYYKPSKWVSDESLLMVYYLSVLWCQAYRKWVTTGTGTIDAWIDQIRTGHCL